MEGLRKKFKKNQSGYPVSVPRFESRISRSRSRSANRSTATFRLCVLEKQATKQKITKFQQLHYIKETTERAGVKALGSNLSPDTSYSWYSSVPPGKCRINTSLGYGRTLYFINHHTIRRYRVWILSITK